MVTDMDNYVAFIPVRGGSKSIPLKNIKKISGRPLVYWTIDAAVNCPKIDRVYVSTDSDKIRDAVGEYIKENGTGDKLVCIGRSAETANDTASTESAMLEFAGNYEFEHIILVQATSPLLKADDLTTAISKYEKEGYDSMLSVVRQKRFVWGDKSGEGGSGVEPVNYDYMHRPRRQEFDGMLVENGAFYINTKDRMLANGNRLGGRIGAYEMDESTYFEIDEISDWIIVEKLLDRRKRNISDIDIKVFLTDCDGIMTDGGMYYGEHGDELKKFNTRDGMAFEIMRRHGIKTGIITGENTKLVAARAAKTKADYLYQGIKDKLSVIKEIAKAEGISLGQIAYMGDDIYDCESLRGVGLGITVADACREAKDAADVVLDIKGGEGAVRAALDLFIKE